MLKYIDSILLPLFINLQDGVKAIFGWNKQEDISRQESHVVQMIEQGFITAKTFGKALLLLDRYFLSAPAPKRLNELRQSEDTQMHLVTKAKKSAVAYEHPPAKKKGRGHPRKKRERYQTDDAVFHPGRSVSIC